MEIIKSTSSDPRKCKYGDFEIIPEEGWEISETFIDYESKLLIVTVSIMDKSKWINIGFGSRKIPTRQYKINLETLSVLQTEEWRKYFNYDKIEIISEDKKYKLVSQRIYEPERDSDGYEEELYDLGSGKLVTTSGTIAFRKVKRENLMESFYRSVREKEEKQRILDAKLTLEQFYLKRLTELKDQDDILCYYDSSNVFRLNYVNQKFVLSGGGKLPTYPKEWGSIKFEFIKNYKNLDEFWDQFITPEKWYVRFNFLNRYGLLSSKALVLAKHINSFFNDLRSRHEFTYKEYDSINNWSNLVWSEEYRPTELKQWCSNCYKEVYYDVRYPKSICGECASKNKFHSNGNLLEFSNLAVSGGFKITYLDSNGNTIREDDTQGYCECIIDNKLFFAEEAKFGGIVIQKKE